MFGKIRSTVRPRHVIAAACVATAAGAGAATAVAVRKRVGTTPKLSAGTLLMTRGESYLLEVTGTDDEVHWESSDPKVAEVSADGLVTAEAKGASMATVVGHVGGRALECEVVVVPVEALQRRAAAEAPTEDDAVDEMLSEPEDA